MKERKRRKRRRRAEEEGRERERRLPGVHPRRVSGAKEMDEAAALFGRGEERMRKN